MKRLSEHPDYVNWTVSEGRIQCSKCIRKILHHYFPNESPKFPEDDKMDQLNYNKTNQNCGLLRLLAMGLEYQYLVASGKITNDDVAYTDVQRNRNVIVKNTSFAGNILLVDSYNLKDGHDFPTIEIISPIEKQFFVTKEKQIENNEFNYFSVGQHETKSEDLPYSSSSHTQRESVMKVSSNLSKSDEFDSNNPKILTSPRPPVAWTVNIKNEDSENKRTKIGGTLSDKHTQMSSNEDENSIKDNIKVALLDGKEVVIKERSALVDRRQEGDRQIGVVNFLVDKSSTYVDISDMRLPENSHHLKQSKQFDEECFTPTGIVLYSGDCPIRCVTFLSLSSPLTVTDITSTIEGKDVGINKRSDRVVIGCNDRSVRILSPCFFPKQKQQDNHLSQEYPIIETKIAKTFLDVHKGSVYAMDSIRLRQSSHKTDLSHSVTKSDSFDIVQKTSNTILATASNDKCIRILK